MGSFYIISGICGKCGKKVVGEVNGCNAMEQVFHIACFVCINCGKLSYSFDCLVPRRSRRDTVLASSVRRSVLLIWIWGPF